MSTNLSIIALIVTGIIFLGLLPPVGMILIVLAFIFQRRINSKVGRCRAAAQIAREQRHERELILAYKSLGS